MLRCEKVQCALVDRQVLALKSEIFCGICESAPSNTDAECKLRIPLPDCSSQEARIFLDFIYNNTPVTDPLAAESLTKVKILHRFTPLLADTDHLSSCKAHYEPFDIRHWSMSEDGVPIVSQGLPTALPDARVVWLLQVAHKFNVKSALQYADNFLAQKADEDNTFLQLSSVSGCRAARPSFVSACQVLFCCNSLLAWESPLVGGSYKCRMLT